VIVPKLPRVRSLRPLLSLLALVASALALLVAGSSAAATKPAASKAKATPAVPQGFVGMMLDGPVFPDVDNHINLPQQLDRMVASGVESLRVVFDWAEAQPYADWSDVPASQKRKFVDENGIPTRFETIDQVMGVVAKRRLTVLPVILNSPKWDADPTQPGAEANPHSVYWYAQFCQELVQRYGPHGSFWAHRSPKAPIHMWQIWNEPNIPAFWPIQPFAQSYVTMLSAARSAIKSADPTAKIVLAGMPNFSWKDLAKVYKISGARSLFDMVAIHPYTKTPAGVIKILTYVRRVMNANGDRHKPMLADEVSWPSSAGKTSHNAGLTFADTEAQQARNVGRLLPLLAKNRVRLGLAGFYYYTWAGRDRTNSLPFDFAGLFHFSENRFTAKPVYSVFSRGALALEHCRTKSVLATRCG
jgi:polysaccharide biosynthesis protein PslG